MKHLIATLTNIFYGLAGWALYQHDPTLWPVTVALAALMLGSGYHHYYLQSWSRWADFVGMYWALSSITLVGFVGGFLNMGLSIVIAGLLYVLFKSDKNVVLGLIAVVLVVLLYSSGWQLAPLLGVSSWAAIAMVFNMLGNSSHKTQHDIVHGLGWHIPTAYALYLAVITII